LVVLLQLKAGGVALLLLQLHKALQRIDIAGNGTQILQADEVAHGFDIAGQLDLRACLFSARTSARTAAIFCRAALSASLEPV
jgi:hypothetical protein